MKILLFDVENFPNLGWSYGVYDTTMFKLVKPKLICSIAWQWLGEEKIHTMALPDFPDYDRRAWSRGEWMMPKSKLWNNRLLIAHFAREIRQADVIVAHNLKKHDARMVNTAIGMNHQRALAPVLEIDTLEVLRGRFSFPKNGLGYVCEELGIGKKLDPSGLWERCLYGDMAAWRDYKVYNKHDVTLLRGLYEFELPWIRNHPNLNLTSPGLVCPHCGSGKMPRSDGFRFTKAGKYQRLYCRDCFAPIQGMVIKGKLTYRPI